MYTVYSLCDVYHLRETDQYYHVAISDIVDLWYDYTTSHEVKLVFVRSTVIY